MPERRRTAADIEALLRRAYGQIVPEPSPPWLDESIRQLASRMMIMAQMVHHVSDDEEVR